MGLTTVLLACGQSRGFGSIQMDDMKGWTIVAGQDASPSEQFAAQEFQGLFKQATGAELPITSSAAPTRNIFIGASAALAASTVPIDTAEPGDEGLTIRVKKTDIAIAGGRPRGTLYGVYEFFERYAGIRFLTCDHTYVPERAGKARIPCGTYAYTPPFSFRASYYKENYDRPDFAARLRLNTIPGDKKLGGTTPQSLISHTLYRWITPEKYGKTHPEYFALVNGKRSIGSESQICSSNPDVVDLVTDAVLKELAAHPATRNISVSQNDNDAYCRCAACEAVNTREGTPMGAHLQLVNQVAERVEKRFPEVKIGTLAYWYTRKPPKFMKPRHNVQVQLCSIECCNLHAINDDRCAKNRDFCEDMRAWRKICKELWIWNYDTDFACYDLPFPNLRSIGPNVKFFRDSHAKGVFMQANGNGNCGEMCDLRNYVMAHCLWRPGADSWQLAEEFCRLHYGKAAQPILDYLAMIHENAEARNRHPQCYPDADNVGLTPAIAEKAVALFAQALTATDNDTVRARVEKASIPAYKAKVLLAQGAWSLGDDGRYRLTPDEDYRKALERYVALCEKYGMTMASEHEPAAGYLTALKERLDGYRAVCLENDVWRLILLPGENGKMVEMFHKPSGRHLIDTMANPGIRKTAHEEIVTDDPKGQEPEGFTVATNNRTSITMTRTLPDGSTLERTVALNPGAPGRIAFTSLLTHHGPEAKAYQLKSRPEFSTGSTTTDHRVVSAYYQHGGVWSVINRGWKDDSGPDGNILQATPGTALACYNHEAGFGVMTTYDPEQAIRPHLFWHPEKGQINLELLTTDTRLAPGGQLRFDYQFEFLTEAPK